MAKVKFRVFNPCGRDVTDEHNWHIDTDGNLYVETNDIDDPFKSLEWDEGYYYEATMSVVIPERSK